MTQKSFIDPAALMRLKNLELRARVVVEGFWNGMHRSPYHGFSVEFTEYRPYVVGDDPRYLDWKLMARSDRYYIKKFEDETNLPCHILLDLSPSMAFGSLDWRKRDYAATLAATFAQFLHQQGDAVGLLSFDEQVRDYLPSRHRTGHLRQIMLALEKPSEARSTSLSAPLERIAELVHRRGLMIVISDLLAPIEQLQGSLGHLAACGHEVEVFQILDPAERDFRFGKAARFEDMESGLNLYIDPAVARENYLEKLRRHQDAARSVCEALGVAFHVVATDKPLELALFEFLRDREGRGRITLRNQRR
jgi:uncharacterized protein (DUF58 family)